MASRDINELAAGTRDRAKKWVSACAKRGTDVLIYCTTRSAQEQARLYRQSRTHFEIGRKVQRLRERGFPLLAQVLVDIGPVFGTLGKHVTMAAPGESWHQYRLAWDAVPLIDGKPDWTTSSVAWEVMAEEAYRLGFIWAGNWPRFREYPHFQDAPSVHPLDHFLPEQVYAALGVGE